jgi:transposase
MAKRVAVNFIGIGAPGRGVFEYLKGMDELEKLKEDVRAGRIDAERLVDLMALLQQQLQAAKEQLQAAQQRIAELEKQQGSATAKLDQPYSTRAEEKRQQKRGKSKAKKPKSNKRKGRISTQNKIDRAARREQVFPEGVDPQRCKLSHVRPVWRLEQGQAVLLAYEIYRAPNGQYGKIPGVLGRSEFGLEIILTIAQLVYGLGLSFDKACSLLQFFQNLNLSKAQANSLLHQLGRHWFDEFDILCELLANSAVVHADETGWSLNSVWAFLSENARLIIFGCHKDGATLKHLLDFEKFLGLLVSDDAAVYANFTQTQKCWAHLLRKAIKLTLHEPDNQEYRSFCDRLLELYRKACRVQRDGRLSDAGRERKVAELEAELWALCEPMWLKNLPPQEGVVNDYRLLVNELMRLMLANELFTFVTAKPVEQPNGMSKPVSGTNNEAERTLRNPAQARKTGRTNKTANGARRQTIVTSVLESLRLYLPVYTLQGVIDEVKRWSQTGQSCFAQMLAKLGLSKPKESVLDKMVPVPDG